MQFSPRLTGASGSPWVATTRSFLTPTSTLQPVPQNLHGALSQRMSLLPAVMAAWAAGTLTPAAVAAAVMAWVLMKSRRVSFMTASP